MTGCTRTIVLGLLAVTASACVTGHLIEAGRRWERPVAFDETRLDGHRLVVRYRAQVTTDAGEPLAEGSRVAIVALDAFDGAAPAAEEVRIESADAADARRGVPVVFTVVTAPIGGPPTLVVGDAGTSLVRIPANAFSTVHVAPWVYPLVPLGVVVDATSVPVLLLFAPAPIVIGD